MHIVFLQEYERKQREDERVQYDELDQKAKSNRYMLKVRLMTHQNIQLIVHNTVLIICQTRLLDCM